MIIGSAMEALVTWTIVGLELAALAVIAGGFAWSAGKTFVVYIRDRTEQRYPSFRRELGRSTLIALVLEPSLSNIAVLGALVAIRTFLSFSIDVELDGCWPWERAKARPQGAAEQGTL